MKNKTTFPSHLLSRWLDRFTRTREFSNILGKIVPGFVRARASNNLFKKMFLKPIENILRHSFVQTERTAQESLMEVLTDPRFNAQFSQVSLAVSKILAKAFQQVVKSLERLPADQKEKLLQDMLQTIQLPIAGETHTRLLRVFNDIHASNPRFLTENLGPLISAYISNLDFGELWDAFENSKDDIHGLTKIINQTIFNFPAKFILLSSLGPKTMNMLMPGLGDTLARINQFAPDLISDSILAMLDEMDAKALGNLCNEVCELIRKLHTGSALLGEAGHPRFAHVITDFLQDFLSSLDQNSLYKARSMFNDGLESASQAWNQVFEDQNQCQHYLGLKIQKFNNRISTRLRLLEALQEQEDDQIKDGAAALTEFNAGDAAESINLFCQLFNRMQELKPQALANMTEEFIDGLDAEQLQQTAQTMTPYLQKLLLILNNREDYHA